MVRGKKNPRHLRLPERLASARLAADLAQHTLALSAGLSYSAVFQVESGHVPGVDTVEKLANALRISPAFLAYGEEHPFVATDALRHHGLGPRLQRLREHQKLTRKGLGQAADITGTGITNIESRASAPGVDTVEKLAQALRCAPGWLAFGEGRDPLRDGPLGGSTDVDPPCRTG